MDKIIDMSLLEQVGFGVVFGQNNPMTLVFAVLLWRLWPRHHQRAFKITIIPPLKGILTGEVLRIDGLVVQVAWLMHIQPIVHVIAISLPSLSLPG